MKVFIAGSYNAFTNELIKKFHKENDKVYVLTGEQYHGNKPHNVFEQYTFPYTGDSIIEVLDSVQPDIILFTGAYDTNFKWQNMRSESMHYMSGLINILMSANVQHTKQFIYLSSSEVFSDPQEEFIKADTPTSAMDYKGIAITQGEELCRHFRATTGLNVSVLRIDHMYKEPLDIEDCTDPLSHVCKEALNTGSVTVNDNIHFSMIHVSDVVFGIYQFVQEKKHKKDLYHISSQKLLSDFDIAKLIHSVDDSIIIEDNTTGTPVSLALDNSEFCEEYHFSVFNSYEKTIPAIYKKMRKRRKDFLDQNNKNTSKNQIVQRIKTLFTAMLPFIENLVIFIPVFMINNRAVGSGYFDKLDFFLLYVLLFAGIYGTKQAVFSAALSVIGYCFRQLYFRTGIELLIDYNTYLWIAQLFIVAMAVGRLRDSTKNITYEKDEEISFLSSQLQDLVHINDSNNRIKNIYQNRIIDYDDSLVKIYSITSQLDSVEEGAILFYAADIISRILKTPDVAIYQVANADYCRLFSATSDQAKVLGKSVKYSEMTDMTDMLHNKQVYINKTMNEDYPLMASAIYRNDKPLEIIMIWGLSFEKMTQYQANLLTVLGFMIYNSVDRAERYLDALSNTRFIKDTRLLTADAFMELCHIYQDAMDKHLTEYTVLQVASQKEMSYTEWSTLLSSKLRFSDYIGLDNQSRICILLTNSNTGDAQFIITRMQELGLSCVPKKEVVS